MAALHARSDVRTPFDWRSLFVPLPSAILTGMLFSLFMVVGKSFAETGSFDGMLASPLGSTLRFVLFTALFGVLLTLAFRLLDRKACAAAPAGRKRSALPRRHPFAFCALVLALCWLPYFIVYFPGSLPYDGVRSLNQFLTDTTLENHHPVVMNMLYAVLFSFGRAVGTLLGQGADAALSPDNLGVLTIALFQTTVCVLSFAGVVRFVDRSDAPRAGVWASLAFFALYPAWGVFAQNAFKDTLFFGVFALFTLACAWVLFPRLRPRALAAPARVWTVLALVAVLACLTRNNGIYLTAPTLLGICLIVRRVQPVAILAGVVAFYLAVTSVLWPALGVNMAASAKEMLSIPFQHTARYVATYPDDVTEEERAAIDAILPYDNLAELYLPDLSDPVKEAFKLNNGKIEGSFAYAEEHPDALENYFQAWLSMGLRHPGCYLQATIANTYAYFYPGILIGEEIDRPILLMYNELGPINGGSYNPHHVMPEELRTAVRDALVATYDVPVVKWFWSPALYVWLLFASCAYAGHAAWSARGEGQRGQGRRPMIVPRTTMVRAPNERAGQTAVSRVSPARMFTVAVPSLMLVLTTVAGPLNGHLRYVLPLVAALPVVQAVLVARVRILQDEARVCKDSLYNGKLAKGAGQDEDRPPSGKRPSVRSR